MHRPRAFIALAATVLALVAGRSAAAQAAEGEELVVVFNEIDPEFDPHHSIYSAEAQVFTAVYEGLFSYDPANLDPVRAACRSFVRSRDGRTYTFYIREEAAWSDGTPLLASDFRDAWLRALAPAEKADYASFFDVIAGARDFRLGKTKDPASVGVSVIAEKVLQVRLEQPAAYFTRLLCHHSFSPVHPSMLAVRDWSKAFPFPVNGPYRLASRSAAGIVLERNPRYWDSASVRVPRLRMVFTDDDAAATRDFDAGVAHWLAGPMDLDALLDRGSIQYSPMFGTQYWIFDSGAEPWKDGRVRRALALLLPWDEIRDREAYLMPADTLVLPFDGYEEAEGIDSRDEEEARALLARAGKPDGAGLPRLTVMVPEGAEDAARVAGIMKAAWERLPGLVVELKSVPAARYFDLVRAGPAASGYTIALTTWIGDFADPLAFLQMWSSDSNLNDARYADPEFDRLLAASAAKEGEERLAALAKAESRLLSEAACMPLYHSIALNVVDTAWVEGWYSNALDIHPFKYLAFGERKPRPNVARSDAGVTDRDKARL